MLVTFAKTDVFLTAIFDMLPAFLLAFPETILAVNQEIRNLTRDGEIRKEIVWLCLQGRVINGTLRLVGEIFLDACAAKGVAAACDHGINEKLLVDRADENLGQLVYKLDRINVRLIVCTLVVEVLMTLAALS